MKPRLDYYSKVPELMKAQLALNKAVEESGIERSLLHLVKLRASQINGYSYCVDMHAHEARADGETEQPTPLPRRRLEGIAVVYRA